MAAIAILVEDMPACCLRRGQAEFSIAPSTFHLTPGADDRKKCGSTRKSYQERCLQAHANLLVDQLSYTATQLRFLAVRYWSGSCRIFTTFDNLAMSDRIWQLAENSSEIAEGFNSQSGSDVLAALFLLHEPVNRLHSIEIKADVN